MQAGKKRRLGIIGIVAALLMAAVAWATFGPQGNLFQAYRRDMQLKSKLKTFAMPPGAKFAGFVSSENRGTGVMSVYMIDSSFDGVKAHYSQELARSGFVVQNEGNQQQEKSVFFCAPGYGLTIMSFEGGYMMIFGRRETPC